MLERVTRIELALSGRVLDEQGVSFARDLAAQAAKFAA